MWVTALSIRRPLVVIMATVALMLMGVIAYTRLGVDLLPRASFPYVAVTVGYPGAGPREVEVRISRPIEDAVAGANNVDTVSSTSAENYSIVVIEFNIGTDPDEAAREVERRIGLIRADLPPEALAPVISKFDPNSQPILNLAVQGQQPLDQIYELSRDTVKPRLEAVPGVASVELVGGLQREIQVKVDAARLNARGLSIQQVAGALAADNLAVPSGLVQEGSREVSLRVYGLHQDLAGLGDVVLGAGPGGPIYLRDVATLEDGYKRQEYISRVNGREGIGILIQKRPEANTVAVSQAVEAAVGDLRAVLPAEVNIVTIVDNARFVEASLNGVQVNLRDAVIITALVLLLFLHSWRATAIVLVSIPTSIIATFAVMWFMGFSINLMTMMALALSIGILVDDSIVILENIYRHLGRGEAPREAAVNGRAEIGAAAVAITLVDVVVYAPVAFLTGLVGQFFREFGLTIVVATLFSLVVSFTLTPLLASRWLRAGDEERSRLAPLWRLWERGYGGLEVGYRGLLGWALRHRWTVVTISLIAFVAGVALVPLNVVGTEFLHQADQGEFTIALDLPAGTSLAGTNAVVEELETRLARLPEVESFLTAVGQGGQMGIPSHRSASIYVRLQEKSERSRSVFEVTDEVHRLAADIPDLKLRTNLPNVVGLSMQPIFIRILGDDMDTLIGLAGQVEEIVRRVPGTTDITNSATAGAPEMRVEIDHRRLADLGLSTAQVAGALRTAYEGTVATQFRREGEDKVDVRVLFQDGDRGRVQGVPDIALVNAFGARVKLSQVARIHQINGPAEIERENRRRLIAVGANLANRPLGEVTTDIQTGLGELHLPPGYQIRLGGETEQQEESFTSLSTALILSIVLMYMLMVALYDSFVYPLIIMFSLPVASVGAIGALALTGDTLNMMSLVGLIMLTGLVGKNAILLVDYTNTLRRRGLDRTEAILEAGPIRLRPILMTTAAMVFAMVPLALKMEEGAEMRASLAIVIIGGLITSTLLTLVLVPATYTIMDDLQGWLGSRLRRRRRAAGALPPAAASEGS